MNVTRLACAAALATSIGAAGLFGLGLGSAAAAPPGGPCGAPNTPACAPAQPGGPGQGPNDWHARGIDQARNDHQPFIWNGQQVTPMPAGNGGGWGFWFLGQWIPL